MEAEGMTSEQENWWSKLMGGIFGRPQGFELPSDSLFAESWGDETTQAVADVPEKVKRQIEEEAVLTAFNRLSHSLRLLMHATIPGKEPSPEGARQILDVWRYELEHSVRLIPETYCGALVRFQTSMGEEYLVEGRCQVGDLLRITVPCWKMYDRVVIRGEAEIVSQAAEAHDEPLSPLAEKREKGGDEE